ncbi:hypothetical protein MBLNU230_g3759t1 [Neophaeotheca triangularis]
MSHGPRNPRELFSTSSGSSSALRPLGQTPPTPHHCTTSSVYPVMAPSDEYLSTARSLALPLDEPDARSHSPPLHHPQPHRPSQTPAWQRRSLSTNHLSHQTSHLRPQTRQDRWLQKSEQLGRQTIQTFQNLKTWQKYALAFFVLQAIVGLVVFSIYHERIFATLVPFVKKWRDQRAGWLILWILTFTVSFPPLIGYSTCITIAGLVYGMKGWFVVASATVLGSTCSFIVSRGVLRKWVQKWVAGDKRFEAVSLVLKHDGLKLLVMIRLCPLPYSLGNGGISTIPTVTWQNFMLATAIASPRLLLHIFVGARLGDLMESGDEMGFGTRMVSYLSILIGMAAGVATGWFMYTKTKARAEQLEAEEAAETGQAGRRSSDAPPTGHYIDDEEDDNRVLGSRVPGMKRGDDDISLHSNYHDDEDYRGYRDDEADEDARERDPFSDGDGLPVSDADEERDAWKSAR